MNDKISMTVWLQSDIMKRLDLYAEAFGVSRSQAVNDLLNERLSYYEEYIAFIEQKAQEAQNELE